MGRKHTELLQYIRSDGTELNLHSPPTRAIRSMSGWGKPPAKSHTSAGPYQHGETLISHRLDPRTITLELFNAGCDRDEWHSNRYSILNQLGLNNESPNAPELGVLRWIYIENGVYKQRDIDCYLSDGLTYVPHGIWQSFGIIEQLTFIAPNPIVYDPTLITSNIGSWESELILPLTFPFILGADWGTATITYAGSWETLPTITITGPTDGVFVWNSTTNKFIRINYEISGGETITITLDYDSRSVINNYNQNLFYTIDAENSDFGEFSLWHDPVVADGINLIYAGVIGRTADTAISLSYYNRYYGI